MGRSPCCEKVGLKKGPWTPEEDQKLLAYIDEHGHGSWRALPTKAGLQRCGKSCRLRWTNYLRPDIKRGKFSLQEEQTIIQLHALLGNRWSAIATHLSKRTDNEIKNYWNTHLKKRLTKMGIDPVTHKPKNDALVSSSSSSSDGIVQSKNAANLSHMAQWESARLEAEARLVRESRLRSIPFQNPTFDQSSAAAATSPPPLPPPPPRSLDVLNAWQGMWFSKSATAGNGGGDVIPATGLGGDDLESPTSTLTFFENNAALISSNGGGGNNNNNNDNSMAHVIHDFVGIKEEGGHQEHEQEWKFENSIRLPELSFLSSTIHDMTILQMDQDHTWSNAHVNSNINDGMGSEGFTDLLLSTSSKRNNGRDADSDDSGGGGGECDKIYWNTILNLVNSSPPDSPMF